MKYFTKSNLTGLRDEINSELTKIAEKNGINITLGNMTATDGEFSVSITGKSENCLKILEDSTGVKVGSTFMHPKFGKCRVTNFNSRASKYPVEFICLSSGVQYKTTEAAYINLL